MVTKYIRRHTVDQVMFGIWSKIDVPSTAVSRRSNRLVLLDSKHRLQIFQVRIMLMSLTTCCLTTRSRQQWLYSKWRHCYLMNKEKWCAGHEYELGLRLNFVSISVSSGTMPFRPRTKSDLSSSHALTLKSASCISLHRQTTATMLHFTREMNIFQCRTRLRRTFV